MTSVRTRFTIALTSALLSSVVVLAQAPGPAAPPVPPSILSETRSAVTGSAVDSQSRPLPNSRVQIRNLQTRRVERTGTTNRRGEFAFPVTPDLPYAAELADAAGHPLAVGPTVVAHVGEIASTIVKVPPAVATVGSTVLDTIGGALSAAAGIGITTFDTMGNAAIDDQDLDPPLSPEK